MKKLTVMLMGLGFATAAFPAVSVAAPFAPLNQRAQMIQSRIDQGIRSGNLNRREAFQLQNQLRGIQKLEYRYSVSGGRIDMRERADLERRYDALSAKVRFDKHDGQRRWYSGLRGGARVGGAGKPAPFSSHFRGFPSR